MCRYQTSSPTAKLGYLDTHTFLWFISVDPALSERARNCIEDDANALMFSAASVWEIAIKVSLGKLTFDAPYTSLLRDRLETNGIELMNLIIEHCDAVMTLPFHHRDPFDRLLIAQALVEDLSVVSADRAFDSYPVVRIW